MEILKNLLTSEGLKILGDIVEAVPGLIYDEPDKDD